MTQDRASHSKGPNQSGSAKAKGTYYDLLGINPTATVQDIRQAYRVRSKLYHPDTTKLPPQEAKNKFHDLNEAYGTLINPELRIRYDQKVGFSHFSVVQPPVSTNAQTRQPQYTSSAYLDPNDRPLSPGEVFALVILGFTFLICLILAVVLSFANGEAKFDLFSPTPISADQTNHTNKPDSDPAFRLTLPPFEAPALPAWVPFSGKTKTAEAKATESPNADASLTEDTTQQPNPERSPSKFKLSIKSMNSGSSSAPTHSKVVMEDKVAGEAPTESKPPSSLPWKPTPRSAIPPTSPPTPNAEPTPSSPAPGVSGISPKFVTSTVAPSPARVPTSMADAPA